MERGGSTDAETWHQRLGHVSDNKLSQMIKSEAIPREAAGYTAVNCQTCQLTHPRRRPVPSTAERSGKVTVQVDYIPMGHAEKGWKGEVGAYVFSSRSSKLLKAYPVTNASAIDAAHSLDKYCRFVLPYLGEKMDCMQTDAGNQLIAQEWKTTCAKYGPTHRSCPVDRQAMNGQVERAIGVLAAKTRALLLGMRMHNRLWPLAIEAATYILNRTPHASLENVSPLEKSTGDKPDLRRTKVFGCKAYVQVPKTQRRGKLSKTAWVGVMVGYSTSSPEWIILDPRSGKLQTTHSVTFDESKSGLTPEPQDGTRRRQEADMTTDAGINTPAATELSSAPAHVQRGVDEATDCEETHVETAEEEESASSEGYSSGTQEPEDSDTSEYVESSTDDADDGDTPLPYPPDSYAHLRVEEDQLQSIGLCMALSIVPNEDVPKSWRQAVNIPHWREAMQQEKRELEGMKARELVPRPGDASILPGVWRFRIKRDGHGEVARYKARWCVDGSRDSLCSLPESTYSPIAE